MASRSRLDKKASADNYYYHLVLLAENNKGYQNLAKLVSYGFIDGFYYKPRVDTELLKKYHEGIIALSACLAEVVSKDILRTSYEKGKESALRYQKIFGEGNFFLELQDHGISEEKQVNQALMRIHNETGIPLVCTNDLHYVNKEDSAAHEVLLCIQTKKKITDSDRLVYEPEKFYLKSPEEMAALFPYAPEALENAVKIGERCNVTFEFNKYKLPVYDVPNGKNSFEYLKELCTEGLKERYGKIDSELRERMDYELDTIKKMGFVDYFLVVWDFIKYAKDKGIPVGPGRDSAAGSVVAYALKITDIDPLKYSLIFERFLNPERVSMTDIDIDFCIKRRQEVIDYVSEKYGKDHVVQIVTFGTMAAQNAVRDVGRVLNISYAEVDRIAKMIPNDLKMTIKKALQLNPDLKREYDSNETVRSLIDMSMKLEGLPRHSSTHAAGVVICDRPVMDYVPLSRNDDVITTQYTMTTVEELGLLKMDFLGLRNLTVIQNALDEIERIHGKKISLQNIDYADKAVFKLIASGKTEGVFQLESSGMKQFMKELSPENIEDIIAGISLYRPGPMDFIPKYIAGKRDPENIRYTHPALEKILKNTYGCIVYQEQVMQIVRELAGYRLGRSDLVRRAMSKKKEKVMAEERQNFIYGLEGEVPGCVNNGVDEESALKIFDEMMDFAKYAFNKSHAAAYAVVAYQTAWLKTYYPVEYMAALLSSVTGNSTKISEYIVESKKMGITLLPPDINESFSWFAVEDNKIRFALTAVKNVGYGVIDTITAEREENGKYTTMTEFIERNSSELNKRCIESLIKAGAFTSLGGKRAQYMLAYNSIYSGVTERNKRAYDGQMDIFSMLAGSAQESGKADVYSDDLPDVAEYSLGEMLDMEKEMIGIYVSGHPLEPYKEVLAKFADVKSTEFVLPEDELERSDMLPDGKNVTIGGIITNVTSYWLKLPKESSLGVDILMNTIADNGGSTPVIIYDEAQKKKLKINDGHGINASEDVLNAFRELLGEGSVVLR